MSESSMTNMRHAGAHAGTAAGLLEGCERMQIGSDQRAAVSTEAQAHATLAQVYLQLVALEDGAFG